jgi:glycosyltransferase involved in cell wall biosynthesis
MSTVIVDIAGSRMGGAARYVAELRRYLADADRGDVDVIGSSRHLSPRWLVRRESYRHPVGRRVALNNVSFVRPGGPRWTLLGNALHFLSEAEAVHLDPALRSVAGRQAKVVRLAARRSDILVAPCSAMAERVVTALPCLRDRVVVRPHPVTADPAPDRDGQLAILVPVLFAPYKDMAGRLHELMTVLDAIQAPAKVWVTANPAEVGRKLAADPRIELLGNVSYRQLRRRWADCRAIYFPTWLESFGYPLAEARACGRPVIGRDTEQNREIAGSALCAFTDGDPGSLQAAVDRALSLRVTPDPVPFDPPAYFDWLLGAPA